MNAINFGIRADVAARSFDALAELAGYLVIRSPPRLPGLPGRKRSWVEGPRDAVPCPSGAHELVVVAGGQMIQRAVECPKAKSVSLP